MKIMLDDFGADYASIGLLKNNLVDIVKVDRTIAVSYTHLDVYKRQVKRRSNKTRDNQL